MLSWWPRAVLTQVTSETALCEQALSGLSAASKIRGLAIKRAVPCEVKDRAQVLTFLESEIRKRAAADRIAAEAAFYKAFGLLPQDYDYLKGLLDLYSAQLGGYYDQHQHRYVLASWIAPAMQRGVAVHELTHALQDQHYNLAAYLPTEQLTTDETMARLALAEGDASAVMLDDMRMRNGQRALSAEKGVTLFLFQQLTNAIFTAAFNNSPTILQTVLIFPYLSGLTFVHQLLQQGGYRQVDAAYASAPQTTAEILDFRLYQQGFLPAAVPTPREFWGKRADGYRVVVSDRIGQFMCGLVVRGGCPGWRGDGYTLLRTPNSGVHASFMPNPTSGVAVSLIVRFASEKLSQAFFQQLSTKFESRKDVLLQQKERIVGILIPQPDF